MSKKALRDYTKSDRRDFLSAPFDVGDVAASPIDQFTAWFKQAVESDILDPYAFTLATAGSDGAPALRALYMRDFTERGIVFFTNYDSAKGHHLSENPKCSANFLWLELNRQVRVLGTAAKVDTAESDEYFASRPRESKLGAWASDQSSTAENRQTLTDRVEAAAERFKDVEVPRPPHWGGYLIRPLEIEFWQGRPSRLHDRICYRREDVHSDWEIVRLFP